MTKYFTVGETEVAGHLYILTSSNSIAGRRSFDIKVWNEASGQWKNVVPESQMHEAAYSSWNANPSFRYHNTNRKGTKR